MELHTCLWNNVDAFSFEEEDFAAIRARFPNLRLRQHDNVNQFLSSASSADVVLTWDFKSNWYQRCPNLKYIFTPAAGNEWVEPDPHGQVKLIHGTFHGPILAESLLSAILFMNHNMPAMVRNHLNHAWDRDLQTNSRLLRNQQILIVGIGHIGSSCAELLQHTGANVIGIRRNPPSPNISGIDIRSMDELEPLLTASDHVVLLLPGATGTERLMNPQRLSLMKPGSFIYNFGRGNSLKTEDLMPALEHLGGAFLDVTDEEPLKTTSPLWDHPQVMITPHSSCVYRDYKSSFINEVIAQMQTTEPF